MSIQTCQGTSVHQGGEDENANEYEFNCIGVPNILIYVDDFTPGRMSFNINGIGNGYFEYSGQSISKGTFTQKLTSCSNKPTATRVNKNGNVNIIEIDVNPCPINSLSQMTYVISVPGINLNKATATVKRVIPQNINSQFLIKNSLQTNKCLQTNKYLQTNKSNKKDSHYTKYDKISKKILK